MRPTVAIYQIDRHARSQNVCRAMRQGIRINGVAAEIRSESSFTGAVEADAAVFYGFSGNLPAVMAAYSAAGKPAVYVDLGYWQRREKGYHKLSVGDRHPTAYFQRQKHPADRLARLGVEVVPWRAASPFASGRPPKTGHILIAGMGAKAAKCLGLEPEAWERAAIAALRKGTDRPIVYRPKPSWAEAKPIAGTRFSQGEPLEAALENCHAVVTRHSNAAVEALCAGIPSFCWHGVAAPLSAQDFGTIETPLRPDGRGQWAADIAYTQWTLEEMRDGSAWRHLMNESLVPGSPKRSASSPERGAEK